MNFVTMIEGNRIEKKVTKEGRNFIEGIVLINDKPAYEFIIDKATGKQKVCGLGAGCFCSDWQ